MGRSSRWETDAACTPASQDQLRLLVVESDADLSDRLESLGSDFETTRAETVAAAVTTLGSNPVDCVVGTDRVAPLDLLDAVRDQYPALPVVLAVRDGSEQFASDAVAAGVTEYVPLDGQSRTVERLADRITAAVRGRRGHVDRGTLDGLEEQIEHSEATLSELYDLTSEGDMTIEEKIEAVLSVGVRNFGYQLGYVTRVDDDSQEILASVGDSDVVSAGREDPLERTFCRKTVDSEEPVVLPDATAAEWAAEPHEQFGLRCYVGARIVVDGELYGTLCFGGEEPRDELILEAQQSTVQTLANWVGYELERARQKRKLTRQNDRLETFASAVSHDLRNPLNVAQSRLTLLERTRDFEHLAPAVRAHERMEEIIDETLTLAREGELVEETTAVSLESIASKCWRGVETGDGSLTVAADAEIQAHPERVQRIFENLFRNSVEHADGTVTVEVGPTSDGFYVADDGPGIEPEAREQVFDYGYTTSAGNGFGLSIVETITWAHGWSVSITERDGGGARFEFTTDGVTDVPAVRSEAF